MNVERAQQHLLRAAEYLDFGRAKKARRRTPKLEVNDWLEYYSSRHLTLADAWEFTDGYTVQLLMLDRNAVDMYMEKEDFDQPRKPFAPKDFFDENIATYVHEKAGRPVGTLSWPAHMNIKPQTVCLEVEYRPGYWYPLDRDGYLPARDKQTNAKLLGRRVHYKSLPASTLVGWRGPVIRWSDIDKRPHVYIRPD